MKKLKLNNDNILGIAIALGVCSFIYDSFLSKHTNYTLTRTIAIIISLIATYPKYRNNIFMLRQLKEPISEQPENLKFVKKWEETRKKGIITYCFIYGGLTFGFALTLIICIIQSIYKKDLLIELSSSPSNMFSFIGYAYLFGIIGGVIIYFLIWRFNERKFNMLN